MGERRGECRILVEKSEGQRHPWRTRCRWYDNSRIELQAVWTGAWTGLIWLRIGTGGGVLWMRQRSSGFHKMRGISWLAEGLLASQEGLSCVDLFIYLACLLLNVGPQEVWRTWGIIPRIFKVCTRSFTHRPLSLLCQLHRGLGGCQTWSERCGDKIIISELRELTTDSHVVQLLA
jgi:hypothetical protein